MCISSSQKRLESIFLLKVEGILLNLNYKQFKYDIKCDLLSGGLEIKDLLAVCPPLNDIRKKVF